MGFDSVFEYSIPYWHPLVVHFPPVLLLLAGGTSAVYAIRGSAVWRRALLVLLSLGALAAYLAERTGEALEDSMEGTPIVDELVGFHQNAAHWTVRASLLALIGTVALTVWWRRNQRTEMVDSGGSASKDPLWMRLVLLLLACAAAALAAYTAHVGAVMVWGV